MLCLKIAIAGQSIRVLEWDRPVLTIGRTATNDIVVPVENVSSQHARIAERAGQFILTDLGSTNGTVVFRHEQPIVLGREHPGLALEKGDRICLANSENVLTVENAGLDPADEDLFERTILAEQISRPGGTEEELGDDSAALQAAVRLARELSEQESTVAIGHLTGQACLRAFPKARASFFLAPTASGHYRVEAIELREGESGVADSRLLRSQKVIERCLAERKGFLFLFESNRMQVVATRMMSVEALGEMDAAGGDRVIICCPLFQHERCYGFIEVEAPLAHGERQSLTRRDLSLATVIAHLVAARLADLENQRERLRLARKATAGFLAATVGHCFKNLLFVPMSISKMLPLCLKNGQMKEVEWMLARNGVNIRYLDILSNEFAAASKDPSEGFGEVPVAKLLDEVAELVNQVAPEKVRAEVQVQGELPEVWAHGAALKRLYMNLVLNAVDALFGQQQNQEPVEMGRIMLGAAYDAARGDLCLLVQDNGPGIAPPILENLRGIIGRVQASADALAELESIAESVRSTKDQGFKEHYGIGFLFVCQTVRQHHGRLAIESAPGKGTKFLIAIPANRAHASSTNGIPAAVGEAS